MTIERAGLASWRAGHESRRSPTPPAVSALDPSTQRLDLDELVEESCRKPFVENVCKLVTAQYVWNEPELRRDSHFFPNEVNVELHMLGALVVYQLLAYVDGRHIARDWFTVHIHLVPRELGQPGTIICGICTFG